MTNYIKQIYREQLSGWRVRWSKGVLCIGPNRKTAIAIGISPQMYQQDELYRKYVVAYEPEATIESE